jgi:CheY-specific phosphatase CheX
MGAVAEILRISRTREAKGQFALWDELPLSARLQTTGDSSIEASFFARVPVLKRCKLDNHAGFGELTSPTVAKPGAGTVSRRALMVERVGGPLSNLSPVIQGLGCEVSRAAEPRAAITLLGTMRRLCLVAVNGDAAANELGWLVASIKTQHPDLPIVLFSTDTKANSLANRVDLVTADLKKIEARISCLLREEFYSPAFVQQVITATRTVLGEFSMATDAGEPCVKSTLTRLSEVNAFLPFAGTRLAGHIVLSASAGDLTIAYRARFPKIKFPDLDDLEDLVGEIANQIIGQIKRSLQSDGTECRMGLPHFVRGEDASIRHKAGSPALAIDFANDKQRLHIELCIHRFDGAAIVPETGTGEHLKPGIINFL